MKAVLLSIQVVVSILLILAILSQHRGSGLSATFGGGGGFHVSKRGAEKYLSIATVVLAVIFLATSIAFMFI